MKNKFKMFLTLLTICNAAGIQAATLTATVKAQALQGIGFKDQPVYLTCRHNASVTNNTGMIQSVHVVYSMCADNSGCDIKTYKIKVNSGEWHDTYAQSMFPVYHHVGHFKLTCKTAVNGLASQEDTNDITVN